MEKIIGEARRRGEIVEAAGDGLLGDIRGDEAVDLGDGLDEEGIELIVEPEDRPVDAFQRIVDALVNILAEEEIIVADGTIVLNEGRETITLAVANTGDRPVQIGSHYHFFETNEALDFDRDAARGYRLDIPAGTAVRFEPGQSREVALVPYAGNRVARGFNAKIQGKLEG